MNLAICSFSSGSSGNCYLVRSENTALLVDAGLSARQTEQNLCRLGLSFSDISAILVTHEHSDHIKGLELLAKKTKAAVYLTEKCLAASCLSFEEETVRTFHAGESFSVGDIKVDSIPVSHDAADPVSYSFNKDCSKISIITDTGIVTESILEKMQASDILVLESNHDESILRVGRYPWFLKKRIAGEYGHLSNEAAAKALAAVLLREKECNTEKKPLVLLAHLSKENNFPEMAITTMENVLWENGFTLGKDVDAKALPRTEMSEYFAV